MKSIIVFLAGPYRSPTSPDGTYENLYPQRIIAKHLWAAGGIGVVSVNAASAFMDGFAPFRDFEEGSLEILRRCDYVVFAPGWKESRGCHGELIECEEKKIPYFKCEGSVDDFYGGLRANIIRTLIKRHQGEIP